MGTVVIGSQKLAVENANVILNNQDTFDGFYLRKQVTFENEFAQAPNVQLQLLGVSGVDMTPKFEAVPLNVTPTGCEIAVRLEQAALPTAGEHVIVYNYRAEGVLPEVVVEEPAV